jgi:hypothetical protein
MGLVLYPIYSDPTWVPPEEMTLRANSDGFFVGIVLALTSGVGVAVSVTKNNIAGLVGVAISASLLPPAVNSGLFIMWGLTTPQDVAQAAGFAGISVSLTILNIVCINVAAFLTFKAKSISPLSQRDDIWSALPRITGEEKGYMWEAAREDRKNTLIQAQRKGTLPDRMILSHAARRARMARRARQSGRIEEGRTAGANLAMPTTPGSAGSSRSGISLANISLANLNVPGGGGGVARPSLNTAAADADGGVVDIELDDRY